MVKFKFFVHCKGMVGGGYHNTHFAQDEADARQRVAEWNEKYKGTEYHVDLVSVTEIADEEFLEDYIPAL
jgi:hypothetical protein